MSVNKNELNKSISSRGQFSLIPNEIWTLPISMKAKIAYMYLLSQSESWNPGVRGIAEGTSMSVPTVRTALKELEDCHMITVSESAQGLRNIYVFNSIESWNFAGCAKDCTVPPQEFAQGLGTDLHTTVQKIAHTQEESKTKPILISKTSSSDKPTKNSSEKRVLNSKDQDEVPEYLVKYSPWRLHYLKSSFYEAKFDSLPEELKARAFVIEDKEDFLAFLSDNAPTGNLNYSLEF